ncbi:MAG: flagellar export protein FliJ [Halobacteriovorax sp.]|nr:flagellar export protein FliJ [Halobacteriovorax sp.]|tara:strand:- start:16280 stop:16723 length:444 start_codon:yes stop_codon:yes gene_type:complete
MPKFKFKLDGLLKLREFKEKQLKVELGNILKGIQECKSRIESYHEHIGEAYAGQENILSDNTRGETIKFFPYFIEGKNSAIKQEQEKLAILQEQYEIKVQEMKVARGETKVIDKLKEKEKKEFKKNKNKKDFETLEEMRILSLGGRK